MRRTNLVLDERLLEEATRLSGRKTYSATVNHALAELVRLATLRDAYEALRGSGGWEGDLGEMRDDRPVKSKRRKSHRSG